MRPSFALLVSLLLLAAAVTAPVSVGADQPSSAVNPLLIQTNETANYLSIPHDEVSETGADTGGLSLGTAIASDTSSLRNDRIRIAFDQAYDQADSDAEKSAVIRDVADRVTQRKEGLERRNRVTIRAYANGSMTAGEFARERARIHSRSSQLQATLEHVLSVARSDDAYTLSRRVQGRLANPAGELEVLQGPVSGHVADTAGGAGNGESVYVETSNSGYTMAYVTEGVYLRETYLGDERQPNATDQFTQRDVPRGVAAELRGYELYPWVVNNSVSSPNLYGLGRSGIYRFTTLELTAYIAGSTTNVFRESQRHKLRTVPIANSVTNVNNPHKLRLNKTYETGPLEILLTHNETNAPVNGTVTVDGRPVGHTGEDGRLWIVEPRGPDRIRATTADGDNVSVFIPS